MKDQEQLYFEWLVGIVCDEEQAEFYHELLNYLYHAEYIYDNPYDENLAEYGLELRYAYEDEFNTELYLNECTMLEMMIHLAIQIDEIMVDEEHGERIPEWFWDMITSLGLDIYENSYWDPLKVDKIIENFEEKKYQKDGKGGLFTVEKASKNLRNLTIWQQANLYMIEKN